MKREGIYPTIEEVIEKLMGERNEARAYARALGKAVDEVIPFLHVLGIKGDWPKCPDWMTGENER
jgi:hypothetical protein